MADVASALRSWSVTAGSNNPSTTTVVGAGLAPNLQQIQATVRQGLQHIGSSVVCAATTDLSTVDGYTIPLSGSATVTSFGTEAEGMSYRLQFSGSPLLKNSTAIQTPTATSGDLSIVSGDIIEVISQGSGNWKVANAYQPNPRFATISANSLNVSAISGVATLSGGSTVAFQTSGGTQLQVLDTPSSTRNVTLTGSNGGNPTIGTTNGNLAISSNAVFIQSLGIGGNSPAGGGRGIQFNSVQSASTDPNNLDDYAEGTWTPSVGGNATYLGQSGVYTKIGRLVIASATLTINSLGTGSAVNVTGIPIPASTSLIGFVSYWNSLAIAPVFLAPIINGSTIQFNGATAANASLTQAVSLFGNSAGVEFTLVYFSA